jgi:hypothetical protein
MVEEAELENRLLEFLEKTFSFDRSVEVAGRRFAVFSRTETESESQFRPRLVRLRVVVPHDLLLYDLASDALFIAPDGETPGPHASSEAREAAADAPEFLEQGVAWRRVAVEKGVLLYVPVADEPALLGEAGRMALGLSPAA